MAENEVDELFAALKKEKKVKKEKSEKSEKKEKKEKKKSHGEDGSAEASTAPQYMEIEDEDDAPDPEYAQMLARVYGSLHAKNPELISRQRRKLKPPQVMRVGSTKTCWVNFAEICKMMNRQPEHLLAFVLAELGTTGSVDGSQRLLIKGRYVPKYIESLLRKYINGYVTCQMCHSLNTSLSRDSTTRLYFMTCASCNSSRSVAPIKAGVHVMARGERRRARQ